jgi:hypothetical protein
VFVADTFNNRIQKFTNTGTFITKWGSSGSDNGQFELPVDVAIDPSGNVFVADIPVFLTSKISNKNRLSLTYHSEPIFSGMEICALLGINPSSDKNLLSSDKR